MSEFTQALTGRIGAANEALQTARDEGDDFLIDTLTFEIADLHALAARNGVSLTPPSSD